ncbi:MAG: hypothetical protein GKR94_08085 [Gammaproteobacteria bacterium]|nr:hypothetical protein [Gammaproteobacteria bacterium]
MPTSVLDLARSGDLEHSLLWIENIPSEQGADWGSFLEAYAEAVRPDEAWERGVLLMELIETKPAETPRKSVALAVHNYNAVVGELDMMFWAADQTSPDGGHTLEQRVRVGVISSVAGYDPDVVDLLAAMPLSRLFDPIDALAEFPLPASLDAFGEDDAWCSGGVGTVDGTRVLHPALCWPDSEMTAQERFTSASGPDSWASYFRISNVAETI